MLGHAVSRSGEVELAEERHEQQDEESTDRDADFDVGVELQGMEVRSVTRQPQTADAQAAHEGGEQEAHGDRGGPDRQLQHLVPHDFVHEGSAAAAEKKGEDCGQKACGRFQRFLFNMSS